MATNIITKQYKNIP